MRRYRRGQSWRPPTAAEHAAMADSVESFRRSPQTPHVPQLPIDGTQIMAKNRSGSDQDVGTVMALRYNEVSITGVIPGLPFLSVEDIDQFNYWYPLCVLLEPIPALGIGPAAVSGVAATRVNVTSTDHNRAHPISSSALLQSSTYGPFAILSKLTATGSQLVWCRIGHTYEILHGVLDGDLNSGSSSATMSVWYGNADTGENITVYHASSAPFITSGYKIAAGQSISVHFSSGPTNYDAGKWRLLHPPKQEVVM